MVDLPDDLEPVEESLFEAPPMGEQERMVEAILFASAEPVTVAELNARMPHGAEAAVALENLQKRYEGRGVELRKVGEAWAMRTAPDLGFLMRREVVEEGTFAGCCDSFASSTNASSVCDTAGEAR